MPELPSSNITKYDLFKQETLAFGEKIKNDFLNSKESIFTSFPNNTNDDYTFETEYDSLTEIKDEYCWKIINGRRENYYTQHHIGDKFIGLNEKQYFYDENNEEKFNITKTDTDGDKKADKVSYYYIENDLTLIEKDDNFDGIIDESKYHIYNPETGETKILTDEKNDGKIEYIEHEFYDSSLDYREYFNHCNGKIDEAFKQGDIGDCWLLAGIESIKNSKYSNYVNEIITYNSLAECYEVNLKSANKTYTFTDEDLKKAKEKRIYATGDDDILLLELAVEKLRTEMPEEYGYQEDLMTSLNLEQNYLNGGLLKNVYKMLFNEDNLFFWASTTIPNGYEQFLNAKAKMPNSIMTISFNGDGNNDLYTEDIYGNKVRLTSKGAGHAFSLKHVDENNIHIINPHDTSKEIIISRENIEKLNTTPEIEYIGENEIADYFV